MKHRIPLSQALYAIALLTDELEALNDCLTSPADPRPLERWALDARRHELLFALGRLRRYVAGAKGGPR